MVPRWPQREVVLGWPQREVVLRWPQREVVLRWPHVQVVCVAYFDVLHQQCCLPHEVWQVNFVVNAACILDAVPEGIDCK